MAGTTDEQLQGVLAAIFALYYQTEAEARGLAKRVGDKFRVESLESALAKIQAYAESGGPRSLDAVRMAMAQLTRAWNPDVDDAGQRERMRSMLATYSKFSHIEGEPQEAQLSGVEGNLEQLLNELLDKGIRDRNQRYFRTFVRLRTSATPRVRGFCTSWSFADNTTDVFAAVEIEREAKEYEKVLDPRLWQVNVKSVWSRSEVVLTPPEPSALNGSDVVVDTKAGNHFTDKLFFEEVQSALQIGLETRYFNLLKLDLDLSDLSALRFDYRQHDCLSSRVLGQGPFLGGVDVDRGHGQCQDIGQGWCRLEARKRVRFDQPRQSIEAYNAFVSMYIVMQIESMVLLGAELTADT